MNEKCTFYSRGKLYGCGALHKTACDGENKSCRFYKTERQFVEEHNRAVAVNRAKGLCLECKYREKPCQFIEISKPGFGGIE